MKRVVFSTLLGMVFLFTAQVSGQKLNIGLNAAGGLPLGDYGEEVDFGFGGDLSLDYYFNDQFDLGIEAGYKTFGITDSEEALNIVPVQLTAAYHIDIDDWMDLYGELGGGLFFSSTTQSGSSSYTDGGISPRIGVAFELTPLLFLDVNVNYTHIFTDRTFDMNWVGLNVGLLYTLGEF